MGKKLVCLTAVLALALSLFGCADKKGKELTTEERSVCESVAKAAVSFEVYSKYGLEPGITVENITASSKDGEVYVRTDFTATGSYTVQDETGNIYSGTFKVNGYSEGHGDGWDKCELTPPKSGSTTLPEQTMETTDNSVITTAEEPAETTYYGPLSDYIKSNFTTMGTIAGKVYESDVNQDGHADLCVTVTTGSGIISSAVVVYDVHNDKGYILNERMTYDYEILGASDYEVAVCRTQYGGTEKAYGTLSIEGDELIFKENAEYGATTG